MNQVKFIQYAQPQWDDGNYSISITQTVASSSPRLPLTQYTDQKNFAVTGDRFTLQAADIVSVFPPAFSLGEFSNVLPHVVLSRNTLPWERSVGDAGSDTTNDVPWMTIFLFNQDDANTPAPDIQQLTLADLQPPKAGTGTKIYFPDFTLDYGESLTDQCTVIDIPVNTFNAIAPTIDDLGWLAHVRETDVTNKSETYIKRLTLKAGDDKTVVTQVSEVVGNCFGLPGKKSTAYLVYLENFGSVLPGPNNVNNVPAGFDTVRLVVLKSWTYSSVSEDFTFAGLLMNINKSQQPLLNTLQIPFAATGNQPGDAAVSNALNMGFAAFNHRTRMGDKTVSWYHGPFVPFNIQSSPPFPGNTSDQFTRYNPDSGMFDMSYSAAWQLGRLLGLQNGSFATALYNWKKGLTLSVIQQVEQQFLNLSYADAVTLMKETLNNYVNPFANNNLVTNNTTAVAATRQAPATTATKRKSVKQVAADKHGRRQAITSAMSSPAKILETLTTTDNEVDIPYVIAAFIARLKLLYGIPFNYLVPDVRMLPPESLRFFYMDSGWVDALIEGALAIGTSTSGEDSMNKAISQVVHPAVNIKAAMVRKNLLGQQASPTSNITPIANVTGFLLRSQVVEGWPGLGVHGFDSANKAVDLLRLEQVGPGVLLCIFNGIVAEVKIQEHPEALHFGVDENIQDPTAPFTKSFRYITAVGTNNPGDPVTTVAPITLTNYYRAGSATVLQVDSLAAAIKSTLSTNNIYKGTFSSAEFALEMIEGVQEVVYVFTPAKG